MDTSEGTWLSLLKLWLKRTFTGVIGVTGDIGLAFGLVVALVHARWPKQFEKLIATKIPGTAGYEDSVALLPVVVAGSWILLRAFFVIPLLIARDVSRATHAALQAERRAASDNIDVLQRRIAQLETPAPRVLVRATANSQAPFALKNVGAVEAHNVRILDLEYKTDFVEFDAIDPLEVHGEERMPGFRVLSGSDEDLNLDVFRITHFYSFTDNVGNESFGDIARRAGIPGDESTWTQQDYGRALDVGPQRFPLVVEYFDPTGRRKFQTEYQWELPWSGRHVLLRYVAWREVTNAGQPVSP